MYWNRTSEEQGRSVGTCKFSMVDVQETTIAWTLRTRITSSSPISIRVKLFDIWLQDSFVFGDKERESESESKTCRRSVVKNVEYMYTYMHLYGFASNTSLHTSSFWYFGGISIALVWLPAYAPTKVSRRRLISNGSVCFTKMHSNNGCGLRIGRSNNSEFDVRVVVL